MKPLVFSKIVYMLSFCKRRGGGGGTDISRYASLYVSFSEMIQKELGTVVDFWEWGPGDQRTGA